MTYICISKLTTIGSHNGLSLERRQANIWTNAGILLIGTLGTNFSEILIRIFIQENAFENGVCEMASICLGLNVLILLLTKIAQKDKMWVSDWPHILQTTVQIFCHFYSFIFLFCFCIIHLQALHLHMFLFFLVYFHFPISCNDIFWYLNIFCTMTFTVSWGGHVEINQDYIRCICCRGTGLSLD